MNWRDAFLLRFRDRCAKKYVARGAEDLKAMKTVLARIPEFSTSADQLFDVFTFCTVEAHDFSSAVTSANNVRPFDDGNGLGEKIKSAYDILINLHTTASEKDKDKTAYGIIALFVSLFDINHADTSLMAAIAEFVKGSIQSESLLWTMQ